MTGRLTCAMVAVLAMAGVRSASGQLAPANDLGVALGHVHLSVKDVDAQKAFWTDMLGGRLVTHGPSTLIEFPGIYVMLRQVDAAQPASTSVVDHFGLVYKDLSAMRARWQGAGVRFDVGQVNPNQGYVHVPDSGIRVEVFGDPSLPGPVSMDHIHLYPPEADIKAMQAWYARVFRGFPGTRQRVAVPGTTECAYFHRFNISFSADAATRGASRGRAIDHIGFDVTNLDAFEKHLAAQGLKFDAPPRQIQNARTRVAFFTDPWGTYIEVTEHIAP